MAPSELREVLNETGHRPYPIPEGPWVLRMSWLDLLFMHWPVPEEVLRPLIPPTLKLDTFDGTAWLGVVPFRMEGVRPRLLPPVPPLSDFPELNLRTYVTHEDKPGTWFFSLDAHNPVAVRLARATFGLPYFDARMSCAPRGDAVRHESERTHKGAPPALLSVSYRPKGEPFESRPGTLENFLTERYALYSAGAKNRASGKADRIRRGDIHHEMWPLQPAEVEVEKLDMTRQIGVSLPETEPVLHFARRLDMVAWLPRRIHA